MVTLTLLQGVLNTFVFFFSRVIGGLIDSALVDLLSSSSQYLDSSMDTSELSTIPDELAMVLRRSGRDPDLAPRIAETLAAVEQLDASARSAVLDPRRSERGALVVAAFDAAFLYPRGATEEELRQLYAFALPQLWPISPAKPEALTPKSTSTRCGSPTSPTTTRRCASLPMPTAP